MFYLMFAYKSMLLDRCNEFGELHITCMMATETTVQGQLPDIEPLGPSALQGDGNGYLLVTVPSHFQVHPLNENIRDPNLPATYNVS
jgi:hypothetical protein